MAYVELTGNVGCGRYSFIPRAHTIRPRCNLPNVAYGMARDLPLG